MIVVAPFMCKGDQLLWRASGNSVSRQQPQKLIILRVSVSDCSRHQCGGGGEDRKKRTNSHG